VPRPRMEKRRPVWTRPGAATVNKNTILKSVQNDRRIVGGDFGENPLAA